MQNIGKVLQAEIVDEMQKSYIDYAMSVIVSRALPDVRDGLKPVHRRILYAMQQMGLLPPASYSKSAKIVGETMGKFHPHGDQAIYDALVRLAQPFSMRYPIIDGQGNFGSVDGDSAAAMRYTEVRLGKISEELLRDIEKDTVDFQDNFDASIQEPVFLPATLPNLLLMGAEGIAVGMATKIPPHNLNEVVDGVLATIKKGKIIENVEDADSNKNDQNKFSIKKIDLAVAEGKKLQEINLKAPVVGFDSEITTEELLEWVKGPDFPTGGAIYGGKFLPEMYGSGRGKVVVRGIAKIEEAEKGKSRISITELPYQVNKALLVARIAELVRDKKLIGISDIRDESDKRGMTVVIELKKDARPKSVLNNLYKHTSLQTSFPGNFVALVDGTPRTLTLKQILVEYIKHRQRVVTRRSIYDLTELKRRAHILEGYKIALDNLDEVIKTIRASKDTDDAKASLMKKFGFTEIQAIAILDMQLRRLSALEREKIEEEYKKIGEQIAFLTDLLEHPVKVLGVIEEELKILKEKYGDERRTKVFANPVGEISEEDLIAKEEVIVTVTKTGYIKRVPRATYKAQARGGKGVMGMTTKEEDEIAHLISASTHDNLMFFTNKGRVFGLKTWEIVESSRQAKGQAVVNLINVDQGEEIQAILTQDDPLAKFLIMATQHGTIKKTALNQFQNLRSSGLTAIKLDKEDRLTWVRPTSGDDNVLMVSRKGKSIRFSEKDVRPMGRATMGVRGILLGAGDEVVGMEVLPAKEPVITDKRKKIFKDILVIMEKGIGKRTPISGFPLQKRGGQGVKVAEIADKTGEVAAALLVTEEVEQVLITSRSAQVIRLPIKNIPQLGRATQGVILMRFGKDKGDRVAAVATLDKEEVGESDVEATETTDDLVN
ncbi:MAG: DNA gyrase subunit A [bacterium]|nr:DNA gyrase subunit A [bacterium]